MTRSWFRSGVSKAALGAAGAAALTFGLVIGCTTAPGSKSGAQGPGATNFPNPLMNVRTKIVTEDIPKQPDLAVKYSLLSNALANLDFPAAGKTTVNHLANEKDYEQTTGSPPKYFAEAFKNNHVTVQEIDTEKGRYDYLKGAEMWVDFAAINLGGGAFHNGFAQEETMTLEMPELANVVAEGGNFTRSKGCDPKNKKDGPLVCSPTPLFIGPVHRTIAIKPGLGGDAWKTTPVSKALGFITPLDKNLLK